MSIKGIGSASQTLLEASGVRDVDTLAGADLAELTRLLADRNLELKVLKRPPRRREVEKWVHAAQAHAAHAPVIPERPDAMPDAAAADAGDLAVPTPPADGLDSVETLEFPSFATLAEQDGHDGATTRGADPDETAWDAAPSEPAMPTPEVAAPGAAADPHEIPPPQLPQAPENPPVPDNDTAPEDAGAPSFSDDLASIDCIDAIGRDLLEAVGITTVTSLAQSEIGELSEEIERANRTLRLAGQTPRRADIGRWIAAALEQVGGTDDIPVLVPPPMEPAPDADEPEPPLEAEEDQPVGPLVNYEVTEQVQELLASAPPAIPLPARVLMDAGVTVAEIAPAILLTEYAGDLDIRVTDRSLNRLPRGSSGPRTAPGSYVQIANSVPQRPEVDSSRFRKFGDAAPARRKIASPRSADAAPENDRVSLIRAPLAKTNRGRDPRSRWYIRGVLHSRPWTMALGAAVTLLLMVLVAPALVAGFLLLLAVISPDTFQWVSPWLLVFPCSLPVPGILYLILVNKARCQICGQRQFFPRACLKNAKAHHIPGLGYVAPVALQMLVFRWFRCTYCGTPVRLKK